MTYEQACVADVLREVYIRVKLDFSDIDTRVSGHHVDTHVNYYDR